MSFLLEEAMYFFCASKNKKKMHLSFSFKWFLGWPSWMLRPGNTMDFALLLPWSSVLELVRKIVNEKPFKGGATFHLKCWNHLIGFCVFLVYEYCCTVITLCNVGFLFPQVLSLSLCTLSVRHSQHQWTQNPVWTGKTFHAIWAASCCTASS